MKLKLTMLALACCGGLLTGCMMPNYARLIPENKSAHIEVVSAMYGHIIIDTRVQGDTNALPPLLTPQNPK